MNRYFLILGLLVSIFVLLISTDYDVELSHAQEENHCGNGLAWQFKVGDRGVVLPDPLPSDLSKEPGSYDIVGTIEVGEYFTVLDGPECTSSKGISWWYVKSDAGKIEILSKVVDQSTSGSDLVV